jgi:hypothetical protein
MQADAPFITCVPHYNAWSDIKSCAAAADGIADDQLLSWCDWVVASCACAAFTNLC